MARLAARLKACPDDSPWATACRPKGRRYKGPARALTGARAETFMRLRIRSVLANHRWFELGDGSVAAHAARCFSGVLRSGLGHPNEEVHRSDPQERGSE